MQQIFIAPNCYRRLETFTTQPRSHAHTDSRSKSGSSEINCLIYIQISPRAKDLNMKPFHQRNPESVGVGLEAIYNHHDIMYSFSRCSESWPFGKKNPDPKPMLSYSPLGSLAKNSLSKAQSGDIYNIHLTLDSR